MRILSSSDEPKDLEAMFILNQKFNSYILEQNLKNATSKHYFPMTSCPR